MRLKDQLNQNTIVCYTIHKTICDLEARKKYIENCKGTIAKELSTLELMNICCEGTRSRISGLDLETFSRSDSERLK